MGTTKKEGKRGKRIGKKNRKIKEIKYRLVIRHLKRVHKFGKAGQKVKQNLRKKERRKDGNKKK